MIRFPLNITADWSHNFANLTPEQAEWLLGPGSLTAKLKAKFNDFSVTVLSEKRIYLDTEQAQVLDMPAQSVMCREVLLFGDGQARVYAQSWIPTEQLHASNALLNLGNKPLGEYIFQHPDLKRHNIEITCFNQSTQFAPLTLSLNLPNTQLWSRRSVFSLQNIRLMVSETFLPGMF